MLKRPYDLKQYDDWQKSNLSEDQRALLRAKGTSKSQIYEGAKPLTILYVNNQILKLMHCAPLGDNTNQ
jgi:hypothetical protein